MKISYAILVKDEIHEIESLIRYLYKYKDSKDEIVIVGDDPTFEVMNVIKLFVDNKDFSFYKRELKMNFAAQKNFLNSKCTGDWIFNIDADEIPTENLMRHIKDIIRSNDIEAYRVSRINLVMNLTSSFVNKYRWKVTNHKNPDWSTTSKMAFGCDEYKLLSSYDLIINQKPDPENPSNLIVDYYYPYVNWPDWQTRIYKNSKQINWFNPVHEVLRGHKSTGNLPETEEYSLVHIKTMERQTKQNKFYDKIAKLMF